VAAVEDFVSCELLRAASCVRVRGLDFLLGVLAWGPTRPMKPLGDVIHRIELMGVQFDGFGVFRVESWVDKV